MRQLRSNWIGFVLAAAWGSITAFTPALGSGLVLGILLLAAAAIVTPLAVIASLLVLSPLRTLIATEAAWPFPLDIGLLLLVLALAIYLAHRALRGAIVPRRLNRTLLPFLIILVGFGINLLAAQSPSAWLNEWLKWLIMFGITLLSLQLFNERTWHWLAFMLAAATIANATIGLHIFLGGSGADHLLILGRFYRAFGTFGQPNPFGGFMGLLLPLFLVMAVSRLTDSAIQWRRFQQVSPQTVVMIAYYGLASGLALAAIVASWSRGAWLGFVASIGIMIVAFPQKHTTRVALGLLSGAALAIVWFSGLMPASIVTRITSSAEEIFTFRDVRGVDITDTNYAVVERLAHWQAALNMAEDNIWLGIGLGNYEVVYGDYRLQNWPEPLGHAHNYYLNVLGEAGIIGLLVYTAFWLWIIGLTWNVKRMHPDFTVRMVAVGLIGCWVYLAVHSIFDNLFVNNIFIHLGALLGLLAIFHGSIAKKVTLPSHKLG